MSNVLGDAMKADLEVLVPQLPIAPPAAVREAEAILAEPAPSHPGLELTYAMMAYWARFLLVIHYARRDML